jgi:hypothetical protein
MNGAYGAPLAAAERLVNSMPLIAAGLLIGSVLAIWIVFRRCSGNGNAA